MIGLPLLEAMSPMLTATAAPPSHIAETIHRHLCGTRFSRSVAVS